MAPIAARLIALLAIVAVFSECALARPQPAADAADLTSSTVPQKGTFIIGEPKALSSISPDVDADFDEDLSAAGSSTSLRGARSLAITNTGGCSDAQTILTSTNSYRARHGAAPVTWDNTLAANAQTWAQNLARSGCRLTHSSYSWGENLYALYGTSSKKCNPANVLWYNEVSQYRFTTRPWTDNKSNFHAIGHFTQLIWKGTSRIGCGVGTSGSCSAVVCEYKNAGNIATDSYFKANVLKGR